MYNVSPDIKFLILQSNAFHQRCHFVGNCCPQPKYLTKSQPEVVYSYSFKFLVLLSIFTHFLVLRTSVKLVLFIYKNYAEVIICSCNILQSCHCLSQWVYWTNLLEIECIFSTHQEITTN